MTLNQLTFACHLYAPFWGRLQQSPQYSAHAAEVIVAIVRGISSNLTLVPRNHATRLSLPFLC